MLSTQLFSRAQVCEDASEEDILWFFLHSSDFYSYFCIINAYILVELFFLFDVTFCFLELLYKCIDSRKEKDHTFITRDT